MLNPHILNQASTDLCENFSDLQGNHAKSTENKLSRSEMQRERSKKAKKACKTHRKWGKKPYKANNPPKTHHSTET